MTVVNFNSVYFDNHISPSVKTSSGYLKTGKGYASSLKVPTDYQYYRYLNNLDNVIDGYINDLDKFEDWVSNCKNIYKNINSKYEEDLKMINDYKIEEHKKI